MHQTTNETPAAQPRATLLNLQALRAVAALLVVYYHFGISRHIELPHALGWSGVPLFFVISGFIISFTAGRSAKAFAERRLIRIIPLYWAATIFWTVCVIAAPSVAKQERPDVGQFLRSVLFIPDDPIVFRGWTLNYEMYFYAIFAVAMLISLRWAPAICAVVISIITGLIAIVDPGGRIGFYGDTVVLIFVFGVGIYWIYDYPATRPSLAAAVRRLQPALILIGAAALAVMLWSDAQDLDQVWLTQGVPAAIVVLTALMSERYGWFTIRGKIVTKLGDASYAIYLIHPFILLPMQKFVYPNSSDLPLAAKYGLFLFAATVVCVVSIGVYEWFEKPSRIWLQNRLKVRRSAARV